MRPLHIVYLASISNLLSQILDVTGQRHNLNRYAAFADNFLFLIGNYDKTGGLFRTKRQLFQRAHLSGSGISGNRVSGLHSQTNGRHIKIDIDTRFDGFQIIYIVRIGTCQPNSRVFYHWILYQAVHVHHEGSRGRSDTHQKRKE